MHIPDVLRSHTRPVVVALSIAALALAGCGTGSASPSAASSGAAATTIDVELQEWAVVPSVTTAPAGTVTFAVTNKGPDDVHEFVVLKTDLDPADLPTDETGAVDEEGEGIEVVDEIEDVPVGQSEELEVTLAAGNYVLLCNIYDKEEKEAHYQMGMHIAFVVSG
jgi:iron uptake system component EfeO